MILALSQGIFSFLAILIYVVLIFPLYGKVPDTRLVILLTITSLLFFHLFVQLELFFADKMVTLLYQERQKEARRK